MKVRRVIPLVNYQAYPILFHQTVIDLIPKTWFDLPSTSEPCYIECLPVHRPQFVQDPYLYDESFEEVWLHVDEDGILMHPRNNNICVDTIEHPRDQVILELYNEYSDFIGYTTQDVRISYETLENKWHDDE